jgi:hypothetical protein
MSIRIPQNQIVLNKYTAGQEYMYEDNYNEYIGYYYELNGSTFAGKEYNTNAFTIIKITSDNVNKLASKSSTLLYSKISGVNIPQNNIVTVPFNKGVTPPGVRYFIKNISKQPLSIKEVNESTFNLFKLNALYETLEVNFRYNMSEQELNILDLKMKGIKGYLQEDMTSPDTSSGG